MALYGGRRAKLKGIERKLGQELKALKGFEGRQGGLGAVAVMCGALWGQEGQDRH